MRNIHQSLCSVIPPHMVRNVAERGDDEARRAVASTLQHTAIIAERRRHTAALAEGRRTATPRKRRSVFDAWHSHVLPGHLVMDEHKTSEDVEAIEAFNGSGATWDFYRKVFGRNSLDDRGLRLSSTIHYGQGFDNALWDGSRMIYGDGDGRFFRRFTAAVDVIGHELTHGFTQYTSALEYQGQSGALNEHISDAFGIMIKQFTLDQLAAHSDWLIGAGLFTDQVRGKAIRSMAAPGTAYDDPVLGRDPQPAHMRDYVRTRDDNGGVHINSGIPNRAFYLASTGIGGDTWQVAGPIWHKAVKKLRRTATFADMAAITVATAGELFGAGGQVQHIVTDAWEEVGVAVRTLKSGAGRTRGQRPAKWRNRPAA